MLPGPRWLYSRHRSETHRIAAPPRERRTNAVAVSQPSKDSERRGYRATVPYYLDVANEVIVTVPGRKLDRRDVIEIPYEVAVGLRLSHGQTVADNDAAALRSGQVPAALAAAEAFDGPTAYLSTVGTTEYRVEIVSEAGGFATAAGVAERITLALQRATRDGWELASTAERDSRWLGGENVFLILRRFRVSEQDFARRFEQEERLRRAIVARLDAENSAAADSDMPQAVTNLHVEN